MISNKAAGRVPYYPAYNTHFYTPQQLCQGGGACYQRVHKQNFFYIDAMGAGRAW